MDELSEVLSTVSERLVERFGDRVEVLPPQHGELTVRVPSGDLLDLLTHLRDDDELGFRFLSDVCGVDRLPALPRFEVVYHLFALGTGARLRVKVSVDEGQAVPSITSLWVGANYSEREVYDMYGIRFTGHPNLKKILTPDDLVGHPLRKDFALGDEPVAFDIPHRKRFSDA